MPGSGRADSEGGRGLAEEDRLICPHCARPIGRFDHFCPSCRGPVTAHASIDPLGQVYAAGHGYRRATSGRPKLIVLLGMWLIFGLQIPILLWCVILTLSNIIAPGRSYEFGDGGIVVTVSEGRLVEILKLILIVGLLTLHCAVLRKVTGRYLAGRAQVKGTVVTGVLTCCILLVGTGLVFGTAVTGIRFWPGGDVTIQKELVGPEDEAISLLYGGAPFEDVKFAVQRSGKHVDQISWRGGSLLHEAAGEGRIDVVRWLLNEGANPNGIHPTKAPLATAIGREDVALTKLLIKAGADPDLDTGKGMTVRWIAENNGNQEIISALPPRVKPTTASNPASAGSPAPATESSD